MRYGEGNLALFIFDCLNKNLGLTNVRECDILKWDADYCGVPHHNVTL